MKDHNIFELLFIINLKINFTSINQLANSTIRSFNIKLLPRIGNTLTKSSVQL